MIQRIQTVWLLLAALVNAVLFEVNLYTAHMVQNGADTEVKINVTGHYPTLLIAAVITLIPLIAIFLFKNRKRQRALTAFGIVATIGFIATIIMRVTNLNNSVPAPTNGSYSILSVLPVISAVFLVMAIKGIRKDEKLVKSLDRLR
ncbi:DUF4293 domain-containing protein [Chitinophagaceae bacterium MMS25-I14]